LAQAILAQVSLFQGPVRLVPKMSGPGMHP